MPGGVGRSPPLGKLVRLLATSRGLERYYSGDDIWAGFARAVMPEWRRCPFANQLVAELNGDRELAMVVWHHLRNQSLDWLNSTPPVLDGLSPKDCLQTDWGLKRLKEALLRFP